MAGSASNEIELKSINELLEKNFFIPSYQRGYRWDKQQIEDLLNDIYAFSIKDNKNDKEFYCLQPIVVRKCEDKKKEERKLHSEFDNNEWYEVIDGQQRLTTIYLILDYLVNKYLKEPLKKYYNKDEFLLEYDTRPDTKSFLKNINQVESNDTIDLDFIYQAHISISTWFETHKEPYKHVCDSILDILVLDKVNGKSKKTVKVIWYELNDKNSKPVDTFLRINMGKIPLTNAELIKALFLQKRNFAESEKDVKIVELRQMEISSEWDKMEYSLQNEDFWEFLTERENETPARIEFLFKLIFDLERQKKKNKVEIQEFDNLYGTDEHKIFRYFHRRFTDEATPDEETSVEVIPDETTPDEENYKKIKKVWDEIKDYFSVFDEWFNNPVWYHYIGFLIFCKVKIIDIYTLYKDSDKKKHEFTEALIKKIKGKIDIRYEKDKDNNYKFDLSFNSPKDKIIKLFLLFNIEYIVHQNSKINKNIDNNIKNKKDVFILKFPFKIFKNVVWDIEHIDSYTTNPIDDPKTANEWLEIAEIDLNYLKKHLKYDISPELENKIKLFRENKLDFSVFKSIKEEIISIVGENDNDEEIKDSIGNLTILDYKTNRSYGNSLFPSKRRIIIEKDKEGRFIPICTKNVFLKYFDTNGTSLPKWGPDDIRNYQNSIGKMIEKFLFPNGENNEYIQL